MQQGRHYSLEELCFLADVPRRTVRYYIQSGLVDRPEGERRSACYLDRHLEQLREIRRLQAEGLSLAGIRQRLRGEEELPETGQGQAEVGTVRACVHVWLMPGLELVNAPDISGLSTQEILRLLAPGLRELAARAQPGSRKG